MLLPLLPQEVAGRRGVSAQWWSSASLSLKDPKGKVSPESGGLSRTVKKFSHNQIHKQNCKGQRKGPLSSKEIEGGRERGGRSDSYNNTAQRQTSYVTFLVHRPLTVNTLD